MKIIFVNNLSWFALQFPDEKSDENSLIDIA
jgi:hypothetical protein